MVDNILNVVLSCSLFIILSLSCTELILLSSNAETTTKIHSPLQTNRQSPTNASTNTLDKNFLTYTNPTYGITIHYPYSWKKIEYPRIGLGAIGNDLIVNLLAPAVNSSDNYREHLMIQILNQSQAKKLVPQNVINLGDRHAFKLVYNDTLKIFNLDSNKEQRLHLKIMDVWTTLGNGDTYMLTYKALADRYYTFLPIIQNMLDSFIIKNPTALNNSTTFGR